MNSTKLKDWEVQMSNEKKIFKEKNRFRRLKLLKYILNLKGIFIVSFALTIIASFIRTLGPFIISKILDTQLQEGVGAVNRFEFYKLMFLFMGSILLSAVIGYISNIYFAKLSNGLAKIIRIEVFEHTLALPVKFFDNYASGKVVSRITNDTKDLKDYFNLVFLNMIPNAVLIFSYFVGLFILDYRIGLMSLVGMPFAYMIFRDYLGKATKYETDMRKYRSDLHANLAENIQNIEIIQAFNKEEEIYSEFSKVNNNIYKEGQKLTKLWSYSSFNATNTLGNIILAISLYIFGLTFINNDPIISVGGLFVFIEYNRNIYMKLNWIMNMISNLEKSKSAANQVFEILKEEKYQDGNILLKDLKGHIKFEDVNFSYNENEYVLNDINIDIHPNESVAFVGHTGSGKSTIMNLIYGFYKVKNGKLTIDDVDINEINMYEARKNMAIVFQNPYIFEGTIYENISLFDTEISKTDCEKALIQVGGEKILQRKDGIDSKVGESGSGFSAGEKQLISFARAMVRNPKILVLDEATANVDSETEEFIQFGVSQLKKGRTTLIIAHRLSTIKDVDRIYVLDKGKVLEYGNHDELIEFNGIYAKMYNES